MKSSAKVANPTTVTARATRSIVKRSVGNKLTPPAPSADLGETIKQIDEALGRIEQLLARHRAE